MFYSELVKVYEALISTQGKLEKTEILAGFFKKTPRELLRIVPRLITGEIFPEWDMELGVGPGLLYSSVAFVTWVQKKELEYAIRIHGDTGLAVKELFEKRPQKTLFTKKLTVNGLYENF